MSLSRPHVSGQELTSRAQHRSTSIGQVKAIGTKNRSLRGIAGGAALLSSAPSFASETFIKSRSKSSRGKTISTRVMEPVAVEPDVSVEVSEPYTGSSGEPMTKVTFSIERETEFGSHLNIIGAHPCLGAWDIADSVPMDWVEGVRWEVTVELPQLELIEYKYVVRYGWDPEGYSIWQGGPNYMLATNQSHEIAVRDKWVSEDWPSDHPAVTAASAAVAIYAQEHPKPPFRVPDKTSLIPKWAEDSVFYQIFPLGFFGAPSLNIGDEAPMVPRLALIAKHLDFLQELGVSAVYFSPLFESDTHGYDTADYFEIDRRLGDKALFRKVVKQCHARGIRVVLDGVFNHTGRRHFAFRDLQEKGPDKSEYANWYIVGARTEDYEGWCDVTYGEHGFSYDCWEGHAMLPRLNLAEPAVREHIFEVARYWLVEMGIDGWRLDVAHEISPDFWREFRAVCDAVAPDSLLVGEMIHGNYNAWVGNDRLHTGTNYQLSKAMWSSLNDHNFDELATALLREEKLYSGLTLLNFIGNHDVARIASTLQDPAHFTHVSALLMFLPGLPCLYYGDELGMEGRPGEGDDPHCGGDDAMRRPMLPPVADESWPAVAEERLAMTKRLVQIKKSNVAFQTGVMDMKKLSHTDEQFIFIREAKEQKAVVLLNSANHDVEPWPEVAIPTSVAPEGAVFKDIFNGPAAGGGGDLPASFTVTNGMLYLGPCPANSVKVLVYDVPKPVKKVLQTAAVQPKLVPPTQASIV
uniref:CBM20 domain-containing protein n=1 Tax=Pyramimonas obovata TaxID=1411642 RepID=A0A7S0NAT6_9CHLO